MYERNKNSFILTESIKNEFINSKLYAPITDVSDINCMKILLENQGKEVQNLMESSAGTVSADIAQFTPILVPVIRRTLPLLIGTHLVGVQAMKSPTGYLYAMTARYTGDGINRISPNNKGAVIEVTLDNNDDFTDKLLYVKDKIEVTVGNITANIVYSEFSEKGNFASLLLELNTINDLDTLSVGNDVNVGGNKVGTVKSVYTNEALYLKVLKNYTGPYTTAQGEQLSTDMKELGINVEKTTVSVKTRKLKGKYTIEMLQDLQSQHGEDVEKELSAMMSTEVALEIDRSIIDHIHNISTVTTDFNFATTTEGRWAMEKARALAMRIAREAVEVGRLTRRGGANKLLVSPGVASMLDQVGSFVLSPASTKINVNNSGVNPNVGRFDNRYDVIVDNFAEYEYATVLYKGSNYDACAFYAPYTITLQSGLVDPESGIPTMILLNRYDIVSNPLNPEAYVRTFFVKGI